MRKLKGCVFCLSFLDTVMELALNVNFSWKSMSRLSYTISCTLEWRHNGRDSVSNHQTHNCLLNRLSRRRSKLRVTGLCVGNSPGTGEFPAQMASNAENVSIWWRHHDSSDDGLALQLGESAATPLIDLLRSFQQKDEHRYHRKPVAVFLTNCPIRFMRTFKADLSSWSVFLNWYDWHDIA